MKKAVCWKSPFYGVEGMGWFASMHVFTRHVKVTFMNEGSLDPLPPLVGKSPEERWVNIREDGLDEEQTADWVRQSAALPGCEGFRRLVGGVFRRGTCRNELSAPRPIK